MSGFLNTHSDMQKEIRESCKVVNNLRAKFSGVSVALSNLTFMQGRLESFASKLDSAKPKSAENKKKFEKLEQDVKKYFDKYKKILSKTEEKIVFPSDLISAADEIRSATEDVYHDADETNNNLVQLKFSEDDSTVAVEQYRAIVAEDPSNRSWHTLTFESTIDSPVEINLLSNCNYNSTSQKYIYSHDIYKVTKGGIEVSDPAMVDERYPRRRFFRVELVALNGYYLKELNNLEIIPVLKKEIATGKVILDIVRPSASPNAPHEIAVSEASETETSLTSSSELEIEIVENKKVETPAAQAAEGIAESAKTSSTLPNSTEVERTTVDNTKTVVPTAQADNGAPFGWTDVLLIFAVALVTVIISIITV